MILYIFIEHIEFFFVYHVEYAEKHDKIIFIGFALPKLFIGMHCTEYKIHIIAPKFMDIFIIGAYIFS
jgi:hypothetical protein